MLEAAYPWVKGLHVAAVIVFAGGVAVLAPVAGWLAAAPGEAERERLAGVLRGLGRKVITPAMVLAWGLGLWLALSGDWFQAPWLQIKLVLVLALSALHGVALGSLRRTEGGAPAGRRPAALGLLAIGLTLGVALLATAKPFGVD